MLTAGRKRMKSRPYLGEKIWQLLFPRCCVVCDEILAPEEVGEKIHSKCKEKIVPVAGSCCMQCGRPLEFSHKEYCYDCGRFPKLPIAGGKALFLYEGEIKKSMYRFKYGNRREYGDFFAEYAFAKLGAWMRICGIEAIVPVPMFRKKEKVRGYNQAESFAKALSVYTRIPVAQDIVVRVEDTTPQKELDPKERKKNLKNAFQTGKNIVQYKKVLVVDDIYTTGSTAAAVAETLTKANVSQIYFLSICIGRGI